MKKITTIAFLIIGMIANAQYYGKKWGQRDVQRHGFVSAGIDFRNAVVGSNPTNNNPELDLLFKLGARDNHVEISMFYENFKRISFQSYGVNVNYVFELAKNIDVALGIELGSIIRYNNFNFLTGGLNQEVRYDLGEFVIGLQFNSRIRTDNWKKNTDMPIVYSGFINIYYKLN